VPCAPRHEVITIGHYIKEDCIYGRKPNHKIAIVVSKNAYVALVPSAPCRKVITIGHYIKEDCIYIWQKTKPKNKG
jgi:hypothetical protein